MAYKIKITVHDDLYEVIKDYADNHDCTISFAATMITAIGAETLEGRTVKAIDKKWGGKRKNAGRKSKGESDAS